MFTPQNHTDIAIRCHHCGENCPGASIELGSKVFCCQGCKTVYEILAENSLCDYYSLEENPGNNIKGKQDFAFLDDDKIRESLLTFKDEQLSGVTFHIPSIHCSSCIWLLENLHKINPGVISATIQFQKKELNVQFNNRITLRAVADLLSSLGYPPLITLDGKEVNKKKVDKSLYYKLGIAGFCFGNIMMLSLPDYLSKVDPFQGEIKSLFTYLSLLLALPVFFYSASNYFTSAYNATKNKVINIDLPIALGLLAAFLQSTIEILSGKGTGYMDSLTGLVFFLLIGKWYQNKTYEALSFDRDYKSYFPLTATRIENEVSTFVQLNELRAGDIIQIKNQEIIPADGILIEGDANIDYSFVTGESTPVLKSQGAQVYAGGKQCGAGIRVLLSRGVSESYLTQLWNKDKSKPQYADLDEFTNKVGKYFTIAVLLLSVGTYLFWLWEDSNVALYSAVSVLIIFCPCTLALAIPFCFGNAMNILGRNGLFLKNTQTIEKLANNDTVIFDKTGTLTTSSGFHVGFEGFLNPQETQWVRSLAEHSTHPLSRILAKYLEAYKCIPSDSYNEIPAKGIEGIFGAHLIKLGSPSFVGLNVPGNDIASNDTRVYVSVDGETKACYVVKNNYRNGLSELLSKLKRDFRIHLISGDNDAEGVYLGKYFSSGHIHFNQSPKDKLKYVLKLKHKHRVLMVGDGLNDAGALLASHCGIAISENTGAFSPACDAILEADKFSKLPHFLSYAKACLRTVYFSLVISLSYNVTGLYFAMQGDLKPLTAAILMPLSSVSIVLFVTLMSTIFAKKYKIK
ncbi:MAG TPA: heavy metal translocating P-type ATPase metal-binding domain-containing protein [Cytophagaceae bacterium]|jgi:Cu+-exporting ATPase